MIKLPSVAREPTAGTAGRDRPEVSSPAETASLLARRPYATCLVGQEDAARRRIDAARHEG